MAVGTAEAQQVPAGGTRLERVASLGETDAHPEWTAGVLAAARLLGAKTVLYPDRAGMDEEPVVRGLVAMGIEVVAWPGSAWAMAEPADMAVLLDAFVGGNPGGVLAGIMSGVRDGGLIAEAASERVGPWRPSRELDAKGWEVRNRHEGLTIWQKRMEKRGDEPTLLLCAYRNLTVETAECMSALVDSGWRQAVHRGDALISRVRSKAVSQWYREDGGDVFLMVDDDVVFSSQDAAKVVELARSTESIACAAYPVRGAGHLACRLLTVPQAFGTGEPAVRIKYAATGFMAVHRKVIDALVATMPYCHPRQEWGFWPLFACSIEDDAHGEPEYLSEDWAFCKRAEDLGFEVWMDPSVILQHIGAKAWSVMDMGVAQ